MKTYIVPRTICGIFFFYRIFEEGIRAYGRRNNIYEAGNTKCRGKVYLSEYYHGYMLGFLNGLDGYKIDSKKEHGNGRPDIVLSPYDPSKEVILFELKKADRFSDMSKSFNVTGVCIPEKHYMVIQFFHCRRCFE